MKVYDLGDLPRHEKIITIGIMPLTQSEVLMLSREMLSPYMNQEVLPLYRAGRADQMSPNIETLFRHASFMDNYFGTGEFSTQLDGLLDGYLSYLDEKDPEYRAALECAIKTAKDAVFPKEEQESEKQPEEQ